MTDFVAKETEDGIDIYDPLEETDPIASIPRWTEWGARSAVAFLENLGFDVDKDYLEQ